MKFTAILAVIAAATVVSASSNAQRLARGLGPNSPAKRGSPVAGAHDSKPSGTSHHCNTGPVHCCQSVQKAHRGDKCDEYLELFNMFDKVKPDTPIGVNCSPVSGVGAGNGAHCTQQTVCCDNNKFNGIINIGCTPININL